MNILIHPAAIIIIMNAFIIIPASLATGSDEACILVQLQGPGNTQAMLLLPLHRFMRFQFFLSLGHRKKYVQTAP